MNPKRTVRVLHVPAEGKATLREVADDLDAYKALIDDAWLEQIFIPGPAMDAALRGEPPRPGPRAYVLICDEEGKLKELPLNRFVPRCTIGGVVPEAIAGPFFVCREQGEDFASLQPDDLPFLAELLGLPELERSEGS